MVLTNKEQTVEIQVENLRTTDRYSNGSFILDETLEGTPIEVWTEIPEIKEEEGKGEEK